MKKDLKLLAGLILGGILGYFIIRLIFGGDDSTIQTTLGVASGMVITYAAIIGIKKLRANTMLRNRRQEAKDH